MEVNEFTWRLSDEGMDLLERAGLAGLYMALQAATAAKKDLSPLQWTANDLKADSVTVRWTGSAKGAFTKLIEWAWQVRDGVFYFPAVHDGLDAANWHVRVPMHNGIMRTFLQHTNVQPKGEDRTQVVPLDEDRKMQVSFKPPIIREPDEGEEPRKLIAAWADYEKLFPRDEMSSVVAKPITWINPGMAGRYGAEKNWRGESGNALLLMLAPSTCLYLKLPKSKVRIKGGSKWVDNWVAVVPDIRRLAEFAFARPGVHLRPEFVDAASLGDAGLRFLVEFNTQDARRQLVSGCRVFAMGMVSYYPNQSIRKAVLDLADRPLSVKRYRILQGIFRNHFQRRRVESLKPEQAEVPKMGGRQKKAGKQIDQAPQGNGWYKLPTGRGRIADNLVSGRPWYRDLFVPMPWDEDELEQQRKFFKSRDSKSYSRETTWFLSIQLQRSKLMKLVDEPEIWDDPEDKHFLDAFHETLRGLYRREARAMIRGGSRNLRERWKHMIEEVRRRLMMAKTRTTARAVLAELFAKAGKSTSAAEHTEVIWRRMNHPDHWQKGRDLALLAMVSYKSTAKADSDTAMKQSKGA